MFQPTDSPGTIASVGGSSQVYFEIGLLSSADACRFEAMLQVTVPHIHQLGFNVQSHIESLLIDVGLGSKTHECDHNVLGFVLPSLIILAVLGAPTCMHLMVVHALDQLVCVFFAST